VPPEEQRLWLGLAARALYLSDAPTGRGAAPAAQLAMRLEDFAFARTVLAKSGAFIVTCTSVFNTATWMRKSSSLSEVSTENRNHDAMAIQLECLAVASTCQVECTDLGSGSSGLGL